MHINGLTSVYGKIRKKYIKKLEKYGNFGDLYDYDVLIADESFSCARVIHKKVGNIKKLYILCFKVIFNSKVIFAAVII